MRTNRKTIALIAVPAILVVGAGTAFAATTNRTGTTQSTFAAATDDVLKTYSGTTFTTVAKVDLVDLTDTEYIVVRFTAESACYGGAGWCAARILVDGAEADPVMSPPRDFAFDTTNDNKATLKWMESHSMDRVITNSAMSPPVTVEVQVAMVGSGVKQRLDDWTLTAYGIKL
jgi:hypothetical protein